LRLYEPILLAVKGEQEKGDRFEFKTVVKDVSGGGLCAVAPIVLSPGTRLRFRIQFARDGSRPSRAPTVTRWGIVRRVQLLSDGTFLFAAEFTMRRVLMGTLGRVRHAPPP